MVLWKMYNGSKLVSVKHIFKYCTKLSRRNKIVLAIVITVFYLNSDLYQSISKFITILLQICKSLICLTTIYFAGGRNFHKVHLN